MAQSTATISGQFRLGFKSDATGMNTLATDQASGNVLNFGVSEDLGGGLSAFAASQLRFDSSNGQFRKESGPANNDHGFHLATLGLKSNLLGTIQAGRIGFDQLWGYNPWGSGLANVNVSGAPGTTENGQFRYTSPNLWGFTGVIGGSMKANNTGANTYGKQLMLTYSNGPFAATAMREVIGRTSNHYRGLGASYDFGPVKLMGIVGKERTAADVDVRKGYSISATAPLGGFLLKAGWLNDRTPADLNKRSFGVDYALSKRTVLEANTYKVKGDRKQSYWIGARHTF